MRLTLPHLRNGSAALAALVATSGVLLGGCTYGPQAAYYRAVQVHTPLDAAPPPSSEAMAVMAASTHLAFVGQVPHAGLMAELEGRAIARGYRVTSWRRSLGAADPVAAARASGADLVIHVAEDEGEIVPSRLFRATPARYTARLVSPTPREALLALADVETVEARCRPSFDALREAPVPAQTLRADIVQGTTGRSLDEVRRGEPRFLTSAGTLHAEQGVRVQARVAPTRLPLTIVSGASYLTAVLLLLTGLQSEEPLPVYKEATGAGLAALGTGLLAVALTRRQLESWPDPGPLLCTGTAAHWRAPGATAPRAERAAQRAFARDVIDRLRPDEVAGEVSVGGAR